MTGTTYEHILHHPKFKELVDRRTGFGWLLSIIMLAIYLGFVLLVAFGKGLLATKVGGGVTSLGIYIGLGVIFSAFTLTGIYVYRANGEFDRLTADLNRELAR